MSGAERDRRLDLATMRIGYSMAGLDLTDLAGDWTAQFIRWMGEAVAAGLTEPNAMVIGTADTAGAPTTRTVLAKSVDEAGVVFYTNYHSRKSADMVANPQISATFPWIDLERQVHFRGRVERAEPEVTAAYWASRSRGSQIGAWASPQSSRLHDRAELQALEAEVEARFAGQAQIPVPPFWGGWRIIPHTVEFWQGRPSRMHDRLAYRLVDGVWAVERLAP